MNKPNKAYVKRRRCGGEEDGSREDFTTFCLEHFCTTEAEKETLFRKLSVAFEQIRGTANQLSVALKKPVHLQGEALTNIDLIFGGYSPSATFHGRYVRQQSGFHLAP